MKPPSLSLHLSISLYTSISRLANTVLLFLSPSLYLLLHACLMSNALALVYSRLCCPSDIARCSQRDLLVFPFLLTFSGMTLLLSFISVVLRTTGVLQ